MRPVARTARVLVAVVLAGAGLVVGAGPCFACSCVASTPEEKLHDADAAFVGRVVQSTIDAEGTTQTFEVDGVYKGELGPTVEVWAQIGTGVTNSCAVIFAEGDRRALVISRSGGHWMTTGCSLVTEAALTRVAGAPGPPTGTSAPAPRSPAPTVTSSSDGSAVPRWSVPILGALLGIAVIWLALVVASRRERRREPADGTGDGLTGDGATVSPAIGHPGPADDHDA
ncbi:MAG: hypothetical protein ACXWXS_02995 [Actinomycetota bacterium]